MNADATPRCRFVVPARPVSDAFQRFVDADARASRLSPSFRAYYRVRSLIPLRVRQMLQRLRPVRATDRWCYPDAFFAALREIANQAEHSWPIIHPWPDARDFAFVLTHDVETQEGMANIPRLADLEEELGFRSSWNFVPNKYAIDRGLIRELQQRGFEIGVHGYNHDGKLFSSRREFDRRLPHINDALKSFGAVGFRAPMVHHNLAWMQALDVEYDASTFDADPYQATPGGVGGPWPFVAGRFIELPYTLPQDHTLFIARGEQSERVWIEKLNYIVSVCGMALVITHPDYLDSGSRRDAYRRFLQFARSHSHMWAALPKDVAAWWGQRDESEVRREAHGAWQVLGPASLRACPAEFGFNGDEPTALLPRIQRLPTTAPCDGSHPVADRSALAAT